VTKDKKSGWSSQAMAGAAVGSAALAAALLYVGKQFAKPRADAPAKPEEPGAEATEGPHATD
jgi:hypothetical protein